MRTELVTPPAEEPLTLAEAKLHLRLGTDAHPDDDYVTDLIVTAREQCEADVSRAFVSQTLDLFLDVFPFGGGYLIRNIREQGWNANFLPRSQAIRIPFPPLRSITWIKYVDQNGVLQTLDPSHYRASLASRSQGKVEPAVNFAWPATSPVVDAVNVRFVAGYPDAASVPRSVKSAMKLLIGHLYENREATITGTIASELPLGVKRVLDPLRYGRYS